MASDMRLNDKPIAKDGAYIYAEAADGSQVKISKADLASVVAGFMPFQRIVSFPVIGSADWMLLGRIQIYSAVVFLYSNITFVNTMPALYAVTAYNYSNSQFDLSCKLVVGSSGGDFTSNIKYKLVGDEMYIWVKGSAGYASHLLILSGSLNVEGIKENPPVDAIQPSVV